MRLISVPRFPGIWCGVLQEPSVKSSEVETLIDSIKNRGICTPVKEGGH